MRNRPALDRRQHTAEKTTQHTSKTPKHCNSRESVFELLLVLYGVLCRRLILDADADAQVAWLPLTTANRNSLMVRRRPLRDDYFERRGNEVEA